MSVSGLTIGLIIAYLVYKTRAPWLVKYSALPVFILVCVVLTNVYLSTLGSALVGVPTRDGILVSASLSVDGRDVFILVLHERDEYRLYTFPYDRKTMEEMSQAEKRAGQNGGMVVVGSKNGEVTFTAYEGDRLVNRNMVKPQSGR